MEALILLALLWVLWQISTRRWRQWLIRPLAVGLLTYFVVTSSIAVRLASQALWFSLPTDSGDRVDAIVVLGRGEELRNRRIDLARNLWKANRAPRIFVSGMLDAKTIIQSLQESGVPKQSLSREECSQNTEENGLYTATILQPQGVRKILLVTDSPHMLQAFLVFRSFGFNIIPHSYSLPLGLKPSQQAYVVLREGLALVQYRLAGQFQQRSPEELAHPSVEASTKILDWKCRV